LTNVQTRISPPFILSKKMGYLIGYYSTALSINLVIS
jgi:hypothetical protein